MRPVNVINCMIYCFFSISRDSSYSELAVSYLHSELSFTSVCSCVAVFSDFGRNDTGIDYQV
jgi:hypothetical protein